MTGYEEFQCILAELKRKVINNKNIDLPPGFEDIFNQFKKK